MLATKVPLYIGKPVNSSVAIMPKASHTAVRLTANVLEYLLATTTFSQGNIHPNVKSISAVAANSTLC